MTMKNTNKLLGISLALVMLLGSTPLGFSEPLNVQLEQGIETDQIQCNNPSHVLVLRTNGNMACVSEKTALKTGWELVWNGEHIHEQVTQIESNTEQTEISDEKMILTNKKSGNSVGGVDQLAS